jgi:NAD(P)-dependent dehydrogenase (short-subunit alcohol dehydrogenase family)
MTQKIALVTGATRSLGLETVRQLAEAGARVFLGGRKLADAVAAAETLQKQGLAVEAIALDVTQPDGIAAAAREVENRHGRLDILVNNAGILLDDIAKQPSEQSLEIWRRTFDTNVFGLIAVAQAFLPLLRKSEAGRIVNVSSILGSLSLHSDAKSPIYNFKVPAYNVSKSAVNAWTLQLAYELKDTPIRVNTIHPGYVKTDMNNGDGDIDVREGARTSVQLALAGADAPNGGYFHLGKSLPW